MTALLLAGWLLVQYNPHDPYHYQENLRRWEQQQQEFQRFNDRQFQQEWRAEEQRRRRERLDEGLDDRGDD